MSIWDTEVVAAMEVLRSEQAKLTKLLEEKVRLEQSYASLQARAQDQIQAVRQARATLKALVEGLTP